MKYTSWNEYSNSNWVHHPIMQHDVLPKENVLSISQIIPIDIFCKPGIIENIMIVVNSLQMIFLPILLFSYNSNMYSLVHMKSYVSLIAICMKEIIYSRKDFTQ